MAEFEINKPKEQFRFEILSRDHSMKPDAPIASDAPAPKFKFEITRPDKKQLQGGTFDPQAFNWSKYPAKSSLLKAVAEKESGFRPDIFSQADKDNPPEKRAAGLMQMRAAAWKDANRLMGTDYPLSARTDPEINVKLGTTYLNHMIDRAGGDVRLGLAMYYAGEKGYNTDPKLNKEGDEYARDVLKRQLKFQKEENKTAYAKKVQEMGPLQRAGLAAAEGLTSAIVAPSVILPTLAYDLAKWGMGSKDAFDLSRNVSEQLELIPDDQKTVAERALSYGVSSFGPGGSTRIGLKAGKMLDNFFDVVTSPFVKKNVAGGTVGALTGVTDHYSRDTMFEGWSPVAAGIGGAFALRNIGNDSVRQALEGTTKKPADILGDEVRTALRNTPGEISSELTTAQIIGDPLLAKLQNRIAMYAPAGDDLTQTLDNQSKRLRSRGASAFPGQQDKVLVNLQEEARLLENKIASAIGNPSRVEGEIELKNFLDTNKVKIVSARNQLFDKAKPHPVSLDVRAVEDLIEGIRQRASTEDWLVKPVAALKKALFNEVIDPVTKKETLELKPTASVTDLRNAWNALSSSSNWKDDDLQLISDHLQDLAVNPRTNPGGWEYVAASNRFYNMEQNVYKPYAANKQRVSSTLLSREAEETVAGDEGRTGISSYNDVRDIKRLSRPVETLEGKEWRATTERQIEEALRPVLAGQLSEAARDPVTGKLIPGKAAQYLAEKKDVLDKANFRAGDVRELDQRFSEVYGTLKDFQTKGITEATLDVIHNPAKFNDFVETTNRYGAEGKKDFTRLAAISILDEMFPRETARSSALPGARGVSSFDPGDFLDSYNASRMFDPSQRQLLKSLNQARAGIALTEGSSATSREALDVAVSNGIVTRLVRGLKNTALGRKDDIDAVMTRRDARILAAALHDPKIAAKVLKGPKTWEGVDLWYQRTEGDLSKWERNFKRSLARDEIVARKVDELMRRMGIKQYLMEEARTDRETVAPAHRAWETYGGVLQ